MPVYRTKWGHGMLYNNTNNTHTHVGGGGGGGGRHSCEKDSLEIVIEQVHLEGGSKRGGVFEANCSR